MDYVLRVTSPVMTSRVLMTCVLNVFSVLFLYVYLTEVIIILLFFVTSWFVYDAIQEVTKDRLSARGRHVLITGCDSGFGLAAAMSMSRAGFKVIAGCYDEGSAGRKQLIRMSKVKVVSLDISCDESVAACAREVNSLCGGQGLWALVNNAGVNFSGPAELTSMLTYQRVAEVNLFGPIRVIKAMLPLIRLAKGRVVTCTSEAAFNPWPDRTAYCITKFAMEALSACLRREMLRFGVEVITVAPSSFAGATSIIDRRAIDGLRTSLESERATLSASDQADSYPMTYISDTLTQIEAELPTSCRSPQPVADAYMDAVLNKTPRRRYMVHGTPRGWADGGVMAARLRPVLPERIMGYLDPVLEKFM